MRGTINYLPEVVPRPGTTIQTYKTFLDVEEKGILILSQFAKQPI